MKKLISVFALCALFCSGLFAQETEVKKSGNNWYENLRIEAEVPLLFNLDFRGTYEFPINDALKWGAGLDFNILNPDLITALFLGIGTGTAAGTSYDITAFATFSFWDFYTSYGIGVGFCSTGGAAFIPFDLRLGWIPGSKSRDKGFFFKMETGFYGGCLGYKYEDSSQTYNSETGRNENITETKSIASYYPYFKFISLGVAYKF